MQTYVGDMNNQCQDRVTILSDKSSKLLGNAAIQGIKEAQVVDYLLAIHFDYHYWRISALANTVSNSAN